MRTMSSADKPNLILSTQELCGKYTKRGYNQTTASGKPFWAADPREEDIRIEDIAAQLSRICRFGGALKEGAYYKTTDIRQDERFFDYSYHTIDETKYEQWVDFEIYSVAQHSVLMSFVVNKEFALEALLHDASEAYIGDLIKPIKDLHGPDRKNIDDNIDKVIRSKFGLPSVITPIIKEVDYNIVIEEHHTLQNVTGEVDWGPGNHGSTQPSRIIPWLPSIARTIFLNRFHELTER